MPKEMIYTTRPTHPDADTPFFAEVGWGRDGHVQIATTRENVPLAEVGQLSAGHWVDLDRAGVNKLIRTLRRARDQAFGRDE